MIDETAVKWLPATILELFQDKQESRLMEETDHGFSETKKKLFASSVVPPPSKGSFNVLPLSSSSYLYNGAAQKKQICLSAGVFPRQQG